MSEGAYLSKASRKEMENMPQVVLIGLIDLAARAIAIAIKHSEMEERKEVHGECRYLE